MTGLTEIGVGFMKITVIRRVALSAGVEGIDFLMPTEVRAKLAEKDPETSAVLEGFLDAVDRWFLMNRMIERRVSQDSALESERVTAAQRRETAQAELEKRLRILEAGQSR
jgi:hypothetical protein